MSKELVEQTSTSLEHVPPTVAQIESVKDQLPALAAEGDTDTLRSLRKEQEAQSYAARRLEYFEQAEAYARNGVRCTAILGELECLGRWQNPAGENTRQTTRALGSARNRNYLEAVLDACEGQVSDSRAGVVARRMGVTHVARARVQALMRSAIAGRDVAKVLEEYPDQIKSALFIRRVIYPVTPQVVYHLLAKQSGYPLQWWYARRVALAVGVKPEALLKLRPMPVQQDHRDRKEKRWITHTFRPGGGKWDEVGVRFTAVRDEMRRADPHWPDKPLLYEAMKTISDVIQREIRADEKREPPKLPRRLQSN